MFIVLVGSSIPMGLAGVTLMPLEDLAVLKFSSPLFSIIIGLILLQEKFSPIKVIFALGILGGVIMVVQPPFPLPQ